MNKYITLSLIMILLDGIYLYNIKDIANRQIMLVQNAPINIKILSTIICYIFLIFGLNYFIINENKTVYDAFILGVVIYAVYETTSYSLFDKWSGSFALMDTIWGGVLFFMTTKIFYYLQN